MNNKQIGMVLLGIGVIVLLLSLLANFIGTGAAPGFGYKQITGTVVGAIVAIVGYVVYSRK
jgi:hypothetical protein